MIISYKQFLLLTHQCNSCIANGDNDIRVSNSPLAIFVAAIFSRIYWRFLAVHLL